MCKWNKVAGQFVFTKSSKGWQTKFKHSVFSPYRLTCHPLTFYFVLSSFADYTAHGHNLNLFTAKEQRRKGTKKIN